MAASKRDDCPTLHKIASIRLEDADTPLFKALLGCGQALNVRVQNIMLGEEKLEYPCLNPKDMIHAIAHRGCIHKIIGMPLERAHDGLKAFWERFRVAFPEHEVFQCGLQDYGNVIPYYLHGDGGRTFKKDSIMIASMFPCLGMGTSKRPVADMQPSQTGPQNRGTKRRLHDPKLDEVAMGVNMLGSSLGNRFLLTAIHNDYIKADKTVFYDLMNFWGRELADLFNVGFQHAGHTFKVAILGMTGDAPFLRDAGLMTRSFSNVRKSSTAQTLLPGVCHLCAAGKSNGPPYEDLDFLSAEWVATMGRRNILPWDEPSPLFSHLPAEQNDLANFFKGDLFHIYYAGVGKDFCASSLVYMLQGVLKQRSKEDSMQFLNQELQRFQKSHTCERVHFGKLTWDLLGYKGPRIYPFAKWSKGMDTGKVTKLIEWLTEEHVHGDAQDTMLTLIRDACVSMGVFLRTLFASGFFLEMDDAHRAISAGYTFLKIYGELAKQSYKLGKCLYKLKPKGHGLSHLVLAMFQQHKLGAVCNPIAFSTFQCEDFVGRVARLSRRVSPRVQGLKTLYRYLTAVEHALVNDARPDPS